MKIRPHGLSFLLAGLLGLAGAGARAAQSPSAAIHASTELTAGIQETVLPNGLKVLTKEVHNAPVVSFSVRDKVGSRNEHEGITGVSHLLEHMMFKGTKKLGLGISPGSSSVNGASFNATPITTGPTTTRPLRPTASNWR